MDPEPNATARRRETILVVMLCSLFGAGFLVIAMLFLGMFVINALVVVAVVTGLGYLHYLVWGRDLANEVEPEREADAAAEEEWWSQESPPRRW